ncbi:MAG: hypothetical protein AVDCRST_MAG49-4607 [uncultured Thermomicrobiales bacterium]|uniref:Uncharacterized protein n=1 Tax=uncultured Thermomicrobiales bacterium TaxID=1645740 RepID=A0A6J4VHA4_9BACT|nr:MAG: hypothetical protein AVDCRST_MAG49-4607 [uncultured Thermomicrobiales bacterium]
MRGLLPGDRSPHRMRRNAGTDAVQERESGRDAPHPLA